MSKQFSILTIVCALCIAGCSGNGTQSGQTNETQMPGSSATVIPFRGNVYMTSSASTDFFAKAGSTIEYNTGKILSWNESSTVLSLYFRTAAAGKYNLYVKASIPTGTKESTIAFKSGDDTHKLTMTASGTYLVGEYTTAGNEYVCVEMTGEAKPARAQFARIEKFYVEPVDAGIMGEGSSYLRENQVDDDSYWCRRGPSVHMNYTLPQGDVEWFYSEVRVPEGADIPNTYFMLTGFGEGYMGIQTHDSGSNNVLFSVWSAYSTDDPSQIPSDYKVKTLRKGKDVLAQDFGNEGSGMQSFLTYPWVAGKTYKTLVHVRPDGAGNTDYTGYFCDEQGNWHLLASFRRPKTSTWYTHAHSFLECFDPATSIMTRESRFSNQWAFMADGSCHEIVKARFTTDNTGIKGERMDYFGGLEDGEFILRNCGFFDSPTAYGSTFNRTPAGNQPVIDFSALEAL